MNHIFNIAIRIAETLLEFHWHNKIKGQQRNTYNLNF